MKPASVTVSSSQNLGMRTGWFPVKLSVCQGNRCWDEWTMKWHSEAWHRGQIVEVQADDVCPQTEHMLVDVIDEYGAPTGFLFCVWCWGVAIANEHDATGEVG